MNFDCYKDSSIRRVSRRSRQSRTKLACSSLVFALCLSNQLVVAQDQSDVLTEEVVVTGSRLTQPNLTGPTNVNVLSREVIDLSGAVNISELIRTVPAAGVSTLTSTNSNFTVNSSGINTVELRNLGEDRTLVLVNGRRFVSGRPGTNQVDLNSIPTAFIERVDVVTGGASAVYGSDALAGVVNIILKDDFEGVQLTGQSGISGENDDETHQLNLTIGAPFADGRGSAMFNLGWDKELGVFARNRDGLEVDGTSTAFFTGNPADWKTSVIPTFSSFSEKGRIGVPGGGQFVVDNGAVRAFDSAQDGFNRQAFRALSVPTERRQFAGVLDFEYNENLSFFAEVNYSQTDTNSSLEPFPLSSEDIYGDNQAQCFDTTGDGNNDSCDYGVSILNPFVPEGLRAEARAANPGISDDELVLGFARRTTELDQRGASNTRQTFRFVTGIHGTVDDYAYELSVNYGRTSQDQRSTGQINVLNMRQALDAIEDSNGDIVCRDEIARIQGCLPANVFGLGALTNGLDENTQRNLLNYLKAPASTSAELEQVVVSGFLSGTLFEMAGGTARFVVGGEYRDEKSRSVGDALSQQGLNAGNAIPPTIGGYDVMELFGEVELPLVSDQKWAKSLDLSLAVRYSDYSTVGTTGAFAAGLMYRPSDDYLVRGQYSKAVRAPNVAELFQPLSESFEGVTDPCAGVTIDAVSGSAAFFNVTQNQNDPAAVLSSGVNASTVGSQLATTCLQDPTIASRVAATGGLALTQPELQGVGGFNGGASTGGFSLAEESADTFTVGFVWDPSFAEWADPLTLSVDWYRIEIEDGIGSISRTQSATGCYNAAGYSASSSFCQGIVRFDSGPSIGAIRFANEFTQNLSEIEVEGIDLQLSYRFDFERFGMLDLLVTYGYLITEESVPFPGADLDDSTGEVGSPEHEAVVSLVYGVGPASIALTTQIIGSSEFDNDPNGFFAGEKIPTQYFTDLQARWRLSENSEVLFGVDNLLDEYTKIGFSTFLAANTNLNATGWSTAPDIYDGLGRRFYAGFKFEF